MDGATFANLLADAGLDDVPVVAVELEELPADDVPAAARICPTPHGTVHLHYGQHLVGTYPTHADAARVARRCRALRREAMSRGR